MPLLPLELLMQESPGLAILHASTVHEFRYLAIFVPVVIIGGEAASK